MLVENFSFENICYRSEKYVIAENQIRCDIYEEPYGIAAKVTEYTDDSACDKTYCESFYIWLLAVVVAAAASAAVGVFVVMLMLMVMLMFVMVMVMMFAAAMSVLVVMFMIMFVFVCAVIMFAHIYRLLN